jgi:hypothetical protein
VHARLLYERGQHRLVDLDSTNGTFVNNQRIQDILLRPGDLIQIGETIFEYRRSEAPEVVESLPVGYAAPNAGSVPADRALAVPRAEDYYVPPPPGAYGQLPPGSVPGTGPTEEKLDVGRLWGWAKPILAAFIPFWWVFVLTALLGGVAGMLDYRYRPPPSERYSRSTSSPRRTRRSPTSTRAASSSSSGGGAELPKRRLIEQTYRKMGVEEVTPALVSVTQNVLLAFYKTGAFGSNLYAGWYQHEDPQFAVEFLRTHVENYLDTEIEKALRIVLAEQDFFRRELEGAKERFEQAEQALVDYKAAHVDSAGEGAARPTPTSPTSGTGSERWTARSPTRHSS